MSSINAHIRTVGVLNNQVVCLLEAEWDEERERERERERDGEREKNSLSEQEMNCIKREREVRGEEDC